MSDELTRDPVVARALQSIPVPDHEPGFWERLEARLAEVPPLRDVTVLPARPRRPRLRAVMLAAAALVLVAAAATVLLVESRRGREIEPATTPAATTTAATTPATTTTTTSTTSTTTTSTTPRTTLDPTGQQVRAAVGQFVGALARDPDSAFAMLTPESQQFIGNADILAEGPGAALAPWDAPDAVEQEYVTFARSPAGTEVAVVTYAGAAGVQAFAAVRDDDAWRIDVSTIGEPASAGPYIAVAATDPLTFTLAMEPTIESVTVAIDGESVDPAELELAGQTLTVRRPLDPGAHVATVAVVLPDGALYAFAEEVTVG
jgi:hypothetical protein